MDVVQLVGNGEHPSLHRRFIWLNPDRASTSHTKSRVRVPVLAIAPNAKSVVTLPFGAAVALTPMFSTHPSMGRCDVHVPGVPAVLHVHRIPTESNHWSPLAHVPVVGAPAVTVLFPMPGTARLALALNADDACVPPELMGNGSGIMFGSSVSSQMSPAFGVPGGLLGPMNAFSVHGGFHCVS
jgi:hypothetical protein